MEFKPNSNCDQVSTSQHDSMVLFKDDDSPLQQINEQSIAKELEKNRECKKKTFTRRESTKSLMNCFQL